MVKNPAEMKQNKMLESQALEIRFLFSQNPCYLVMCLNYIKYLYPN